MYSKGKKDYIIPPSYWPKTSECCPSLYHLPSQGLPPSPIQPHPSNLSPSSASIPLRHAGGFVGVNFALSSFMGGANAAPLIIFIVRSFSASYQRRFRTYTFLQRCQRWKYSILSENTTHLDWTLKRLHCKWRASENPICRVPIYVFPDMKLCSLVISKTEL